MTISEYYKLKENQNRIFYFWQTTISEYYKLKENRNRKKKSPSWICSSNFHQFNLPRTAHKANFLGNCTYTAIRQKWRRNRMCSSSNRILKINLQGESMSEEKLLHYIRKVAFSWVHVSPFSGVRYQCVAVRLEFAVVGRRPLEARSQSHEPYIQLR